MKYTILSFFLCASLFFISCGNDNNVSDCTSSSFTSEVNAAINALNAAGQTWVTDPTSENCEKYKDAANDYLDVVENLDGCPGVSQSDYDAAIDAARDAVDQIPC